MAHELREAWITKATDTLRPFFSGHGYEIPKNVRVSCGFPSVGGLRASKRRIGEAWASTSSSSNHFEIFISPTVSKPFEVLAILVHELVHVTVGLEAGHKGKFRECAMKVGLEGKMTATTAGDFLSKKLLHLVKKLGPYPHGNISAMTSGHKKQTSRLIKADCPECTYTIRASMKWLLLAVPSCPNEDCGRNGEMLDVEWPDATPAV